MVSTSYLKMRYKMGIFTNEIKDQINVEIQKDLSERTMADDLANLIDKVEKLDEAKEKFELNRGVFYMHPDNVQLLKIRLNPDLTDEEKDLLIEHYGLNKKEEPVYYDDYDALVNNTHIKHLISDIDFIRKTVNSYEEQERLMKESLYYYFIRLNLIEELRASGEDGEDENI